MLLMGMEERINRFARHSIGIGIGIAIAIGIDIGTEP